MPKYDVFLSHNSTDKPAVETLAHRLRQEAQLEPFLDKWHLVPGAPWQEALENALDQADTCAVFLGPGGMGTWENEEMRVALDRRVNSPDYRVIPVLLPGASLPERGRLPRFLARHAWVDFRSGLDDADAFYRLVCGIKGIGPGPQIDAEAEAEAVCPFRGLQVFDEEHSRFFFGRGALTQHLVEQLREERFLAVIGPSGSGKSSLVRAGLISQLRQGALPSSDKWPIVVFKPGPHPLETLSAKLLPHLNHNNDPLTARETLLETLQQNERGSHSAVQVALAAAPDSQRLLLVVDQFEELFTLCRDEQACSNFITNLLYASSIAGGQTIVVLTMRADFFGKCAVDPNLAARLAERDVLVGPMTSDELREAIEAPAEAVGLSYEKGLVNIILDDLENEPGILPLLQHMLLELWERRRGHWLTIDAYHEIGGVRGALTQRAEVTFARLTPPQQAETRRILLRLTQPGEGTEDTRRRVELEELQPVRGSRSDVETAIRKLTDARLLTTDTDEQGREIVDVTHEALTRGWPRLHQWIDENREALLTHRRLTEAAEEWNKHNRDSSYLYQGTRLSIAEEWAKIHRNDLNALENEFLRKSTLTRKIKNAFWTTVKIASALFVVGILTLMIAEIGPFAPRVVWSPVHRFENVEVTHLIWADDGTMYAGLGGDAAILSLSRSRDGGKSWEALNLKGQFLYSLLIDPEHSNIIYASLGKEGVFRSRDGGVTWVSIGNELPMQEVDALAISPANELYAGDFSQARGVYVSQDQGDTWTPLAGSPASPVYYLEWTNNRLLVGTNEGLWQYAADTGWTHLIDEAVYIYDAAIAGNVLFAGGSGLFTLKDGVVTRRRSEYEINNIHMLPGEIPHFVASTVDGQVLYWQLDSEEVQILARRQNLGDVSYLYVAAIQPDSTRRFWVGTSSGLRRGDLRRWFEFWSQ